MRFGRSNRSKIAFAIVLASVDLSETPLRIVGLQSIRAHIQAGFTAKKHFLGDKNDTKNKTEHNHGLRCRNGRT